MSPNFKGMAQKVERLERHIVRLTMEMTRPMPNADLHMTVDKLNWTVQMIVVCWF